MTTTYTQRHNEGSRSRTMDELMAERGDPVFGGADDDGNELYTFPDGGEVILTNAGVVGEGDDGFAGLRARVE